MSYAMCGLLERSWLVRLRLELDLDWLHRVAKVQENDPATKQGAYENRNDQDCAHLYQTFQ
jgi:hypothetical protein